jgi:hypothetical protein
MSRRLLNYRDILRAEEVTAAIAREKIGDWFDKFEQVNNLLLKLNYYFDNAKSATEETSRNWLFSFAQGKYLEAPHSLHVCNSLMERGHYLNAVIQLRSMLDFFVSCRYFHNNPQHLIPYKKSQKRQIEGKEIWLGPSQIYGYFSKDYYDRYYGDMLSCLSHGKIGTEIYRIDRSNPLEARVILVSEFNLIHSFTIINHLVPIMYGYLSHWEIFFENWTKPVPPELENERIDMVKWLKKLHQEQKEKFPGSTDWVDGINKIIGITES